jgi:hypothetical protein
MSMMAGDGKATGLVTHITAGPLGFCYLPATTTFINT